MQTQTVSQMKEKESAQFLRHVLRANTIFSLLSALVLIFAANALSEVMGIENPVVFYVVGVGLLPFAAFVYYTSQPATLNRQFVKIILVLDLVWVMGSYLLIFSGVFPLTTAGKWIVGLVAEVVFIFAVLEGIGLRRLS